MKRNSLVRILFVFGLPLFLFGFSSSRHSGSSTQKLSPLSSGRQFHLNSNYSKFPLAFEPNQGQTDPQVKFLARGSGYTLFVTSQGMVLSLKKPKALSRDFPGKGFRAKDSLFPTAVTTPPTVLRLKPEGAQANPTFENLEQLPGISNYFIGKDPAQWHTNIPQYSKVAVRGLYPGVDMVYYGNQGKLEYDFVVQPGADPGSIHLKVDGAQGVQVNGQGDMELTTAQGKVVFHAPTVYQQVEGQKNPLEGHYQLEEGNKVGFEVKNYDKSKPLVIDPVLDYSTYLAGYSYGSEAGESIAVNGSGEAYVMGQTEGFITTTNGAFQSTIGGGFDDVFVAKVNSSGSALLYSTYLGGNSDDTGGGIAVDGSGNAYVTGTTDSPNFPTTPGAYQTVYGGGAWDAFVTELNPTGTAMVYSTYLGGGGYDWGTAIAVDGFGEAYVTGYTSGNFPITPGAYQTVNAGSFDIYVTKLNSSGMGLIYSTYLGGNDMDEAYSIVVNGSGNAYVTGYTISTNFPTTSGAFQSALGGPGARNVFVTELDTSGASVIYSTYLGGNGTDTGYGIALDGSGNAYVGGDTSSTNFPITGGAFQTIHNVASSTSFVTKLNPLGSNLIYSTYLGGSSTDRVSGIAVYGTEACVAGTANSTNFPITSGAFQTVFGGGTGIYPADAFMTVLNSFGNSLVYSTYLGGNQNDGANAIAVDGLGNVYVAGGASWNFPTTSGSYESSYGGGSYGDAFTTKFDVANFNFPTPTLTFTQTSTNTSTSTPANSPTVTDTPTITLTPTQTYTQTATNSATNSSTITPTSTPSNSSTQTPTRTPSSTATNSPTSTPSNSPTNSPTITPTSTPTNSPTVTDTPTITLTPTQTYTPTVTLTATNSPTNTSTMTPTKTPTRTFTFTVTNTPTNTYTPTHTLTYTKTFTPSNTPTPTYTFTITNTPTKTFTPTITYTPTNSPTFPTDCDAFHISKNLFTPNQGPVSVYVVNCGDFEGNYSLNIYNSVGERIKTLDERNLTGPFYASYLWDGTNKYGEHCASGVYIFCLTNPFEQKIKRVLLVR